ncbi:SEC14-like protein 2 [Lucilia sericata]|uniref:SEC14-like protein 2 n=1 Tax=Lucilia sericata TaxID=13632 RepID=UPI0018A85E3A|nr:SEC14-like protein 2 [Lucilia sericata]XP_037809070.1 SEC14-like protein 2 [Lucilia sericata]XP_037809848.1 SEC14-like protein 2 [Lucilia sericata]
MSNQPEITESQKQILATFRESVKDVLNETHDDYFLMRWLRARKWNPENAEKMLRASLKTRAMWNVDSLEKWEAPKALKEYLPYGMVGFDNEGSPIIVCPFYNFDIYGMLHCVTRFDFQRYVVMLLERFMKAGYEQSKIHGPKARQLVVYFDVADFNLKQYAWRPATELIISMIKQYEQNYPEILKMCYIVNAPKLFSVGFNFIKKFLDEYTMSKINIYKSGSDKWKDALFSHVDPNIFPKCFGGKFVENGDERCPNMIVWAGKIPKDLYLEQKEEFDSNKNFIETIVNKGNKLKLEFDVGEKKPGEEDQILSWEFRTFDYDIKFGIYSVDKITGVKQSEVHLGTVSSNEMDEVGFFFTRPNTKYTVVFDNSGSYLRSKKLRYWVSLISENDDITELPSQQGQTELVVADK